jgi:hypothetical protein
MSTRRVNTGVIGGEWGKFKVIPAGAIKGIAHIEKGISKARKREIFF